MKADIKKHELLKILSSERLKPNTILGVGFSEILKTLKIDKEYLDFLCGELYGTDEIKYFDNGINEKGLYATSLGASSYSSNKYVKRNNEKKWSVIKNWVQTAVPILSLIVAIIVLLLSNYNNLVEVKSELKEVKERIKKEEILQYELEERTKNTGIDSLKIE